MVRKEFFAALGGKLLGLVLLPGMIVLGAAIADKAGDSTTALLVVIGIVAAAFLLSGQADKYQQQSGELLFSGFGDFLLSTGWLVPLLIGAANLNSETPSLWGPVLVGAAVLLFICEPLWRKAVPGGRPGVTYFWRTWLSVLSLSIIVLALAMLSDNKEENRSTGQKVVGLMILAAIGWFIYKHFFGRFGIVQAGGGVQRR